nr:MAG TPA: hypothetical protein [Caudoviricetes sp.]
MEQLYFYLLPYCYGEINKVIQTLPDPRLITPNYKISCKSTTIFLINN